MKAAGKAVTAEPVAEELARRLPQARVDSAFNTVPSEVLYGVYEAKRKATRPSLVYCATTMAAKLSLLS